MSVTKKIGIIGCGNMGGAILYGALESGVLSKENVYVYDINPAMMEKADSWGVHLAKDDEDVCDPSRRKTTKCGRSAVSMQKGTGGQSSDVHCRRYQRCTPPEYGRWHAPNPQNHAKHSGHGIRGSFCTLF